jgi:ribonucleoside-diphosphate reductase alpha chain
LSDETKGKKTVQIPTDLAERPVALTPNAETVLRKRYLRRGPDGQPAETINEMFWRVAWHVAQPEAEWALRAAAEEAARRFYDLMTSLKFLPNSPTFTGAGTPLGQLSACFVLQIEDDMGKVQSGIFDTLKDAVLIQQSGGGNGFSFGRLRPRGALVRSSMGQATGPVGFLRVYDKAFGEVSQGGARRSANMAVLPVSHPDIREFVRCKANEGEITNFNVSVGASDEFMQAVEAGANFDLRFGGQVYETVDARALFREIVEHAHHNGEPGMIFLDAANRANPVPHLYQLETSNPCGEQLMGPFENCCLGSINLAQHLKADDQMDWEALAETVRLATRFLDDVVSANGYVPAVPELKEAALLSRRIGLGIMGLADVLYSQALAYDSPEGREMAAQIMEFVRYWSMRESVALARERGSFPAIQGSVFDPHDFRWQPPANGRQNWQALIDGIKAYGIRNCNNSTIAPTGTLSTVSGVEGYGCEPVFALAYLRHVQGDNGRFQLAYTSPLFEQALIRAGLDEQTRQRIAEQVLLTGSCQDVAEVPAHIKEVFKVASDISAQDHVAMQAALQQHVCNAISKTINCPPDATVDDVAAVYMQAWKEDCKGITVYVTGSRETVVLETKQTAQAKQQPTQILPPPPPQPGPINATNGNGNGNGYHHDHHDHHDAKKPRPRRLSGATYFSRTPLGKAYVTVNRNGNNEPFEVFATVGKAGSDTFAIAEAMGRLLSLLLRVPSSLSPTERLQEAAEQLAGIGGSRSLGFGPGRVLSLPDAIAQVLAEDLAAQMDGASLNATETLVLAQAFEKEFGLNADLCPECGHASFVNEEGCRKCYSCAYSEC